MSEALIADLDAALLEYGEDAVLRRVGGATGAPANLDVNCRVHVRSYRLRDQELVAKTAISQEDLLIIMSPSEIAAAQWPGGGAPAGAEDPSIPRKGDKLRVRGRFRNIEVVDPIKAANVLVRIEMRLLG